MTNLPQGKHAKINRRKQVKERKRERKAYLRSTISSILNIRNKDQKILIHTSPLGWYKLLGLLSAKKFKKNIIKTRG